MDCVEVCPVDCFYEGENMLVIHPDECRLRGRARGVDHIRAMKLEPDRAGTGVSGQR
jgi:formate hydrogenlyase subunit 6/NADH:ubiquinone oxidoreductase subunit I